MNNKLEVRFQRSLTPVNKQYIKQKVRRYLENSAPDNSKRAYKSDWQDFELWCAVNQVTSMPADPSTVQAYISDLADRNYKTSTIARRLSSISIAHQAKNFPTPTQSLGVKKVWKGIRQEHGMMSVSKDPLLANDIRKLIDKVNVRTLRGLRDRALILVGYAGAFRRSELISIDISDIEFREDGMIITIRRSKTDQDGQGREIGIVYGQSKDFCAVTAVQEWIQEAWIFEGAVFRKVSKADNVESRRLTGQSVSKIVKHYADAAGLKAEKYGAHSLRSGFATQAARNGSTEAEIMEQTGHRSLATVRRYIHRGSIFRNNPSGNIGM